ncbi:MAG: hypothetical protein ABIJ16_05975 [Bacteroidota bacterium]
MRQLLFILLIGLPAGLIHAQEPDTTNNVDEDTYKTLISDDINVTGFAGPYTTISGIDGHTNLMMGGGGAIIFADWLLIGGYGTGMTSNMEAKKGEFIEKELDFGHGGFWTGCIIHSKGFIHPAVSAMAGWGNISVTGASGYPDRERYDKFFCVTPVLEIEINAADFLRVCIGGSYRYISGLEFSDYSDSDFSSPEFWLCLKFGWFKPYQPDID